MSQDPTSQPIVVRHIDGKEERVVVHLLPIRRVQKFTGAIDDMAACAEIYCDRPSGWADKLTNESVFAVVEEGDRLNGPNFAELVRFGRERSVRLMEQAGMKVPDSLRDATEAKG